MTFKHPQENAYNVKSATIDRFTPVWQENFQKNRNKILKHNPVKNFFAKFNDVPSIVVGAGPSLSKNIQYLKYAKDRSLIIACDAALKILIKESIIPSFVGILDPQDHIVKFFEGVDTRSITLIAPTIVHPKVLDAWNGKIVFYNKFAPDIPILDKIAKDLSATGSLTPGGSVLSVCYDFAFRSESNPIIFVGQDLSYPTDQVYARGSDYEAMNLKEVSQKERGNIVYVKDIYGKTIPTLKSMSLTKVWFEWAFKTWKRQKPALIFNGTEGGILANNCSVIPFREAIINYCQKKINTRWAIDKILK